MPKCNSHEELINEPYEPKEDRNIETNIYMKEIIFRFTKVFLR